MSAVAPWQSMRVAEVAAVATANGVERHNGRRVLSCALWGVGALILSAPVVAITWRLVGDESAWLSSIPVVAAVVVTAVRRSGEPTGRVNLPGPWTGALVFASCYPVALALAAMIVNAQAEVTGAEVVALLVVLAIGLIPYGCLRADEPWRPATGWAILWTVLTVLLMPLFLSGTIFLPQAVSMWVGEHQLRAADAQPVADAALADPAGAEPAA